MQEKSGCSDSMALNLTSTVVLNDGKKMPVFGLGVYEAQANGETEQAVLWALKHGYRLIDTAALYRLVDKWASQLALSSSPGCLRTRLS